MREHDSSFLEPGCGAIAINPSRSTKAQLFPQLTAQVQTPESGPIGNKRFASAQMATDAAPFPQHDMTYTTVLQEFIPRDAPWIALLSRLQDHFARSVSAFEAV